LKFGGQRVRDNGVGACHGAVVINGDGVGNALARLGRAIINGFGQEQRRLAEFLNPIIALIGYIDIVGTIDGYVRWPRKLAITGTRRAPLGQKDAITVKLLDTMGRAISYINVTCTIGPHPGRRAELTVTAASDSSLARSSADFKCGVPGADPKTPHS